MTGSETIGPLGKVGYPWGAVGMALDYRIRLNFPASARLPDRWATWAQDPEAGFAVSRDPALHEPLVAERGAARAIDIYEAYTWRRAAGAFFSALAGLLTKARPHELAIAPEQEEALCRFCFVLGLYEQFQRTLSAWATSPLIDLGVGGGVEDLLALCPDLAVRDIASLNGAFVSSQAHLLRGEVVLNPRFDGVAPIGGDGDLIVDRCYIDIKATTEPTKPSPSQWPWELLGYVLLDHEDRFHINSVGLYLARQAVLVRWDLDEFVSLLVGPRRGIDLELARGELRGELARLSKAAQVAKQVAKQMQARRALRLRELHQRCHRLAYDSDS